MKTVPDILANYRNARIATMLGEEFDSSYIEYDDSFPGAERVMKWLHKNRYKLVIMTHPQDDLYRVTVLTKRGKRYHAKNKSLFAAICDAALLANEGRTP